MSALIVECPQCFNDVLTMADGRCPSCLGDTRKPPADGEHLTKVSLHHQALELPDVCMVCGMFTRRRTRFSERAKNERCGANPDPQGDGLSALLGLLFDYVSGKMHQQIFLQAPHCEECHQRRRILRVQHLDFDRRIATFIVHRNFRQALDAQKCR